MSEEKTKTNPNNKKMLRDDVYDTIDTGDIKSVVHSDPVAFVGGDGGAAHISLHEETKLFGIAPVTSIVRIVYNCFLLFTCLCALSLISIGDSFVGLIFVGYAQFLSAVIGAAGSILFFYLGDTANRRKQGFSLTVSFALQNLVVSLAIFIHLIYWVSTGLYGPYVKLFVLTLFIMFQSMIQFLVTGVMSWRMYLYL